MEPNVLIAIPSPRDIDEIKESLEKITKYDKLWIKYSPEWVTYPLMRRHFLHHESNHYTHLIISPDDLIIDQKSVDTLLKDYELIPEQDRDTTILSGFCNVDTSTHVKEANISDEDTSIEPNRHKRFYRFMKLERLRKYARQNPDNPLIPVFFSGFALIVIPRKVVEQIEFRNDSFTGKFDEDGCCVDVMFCHDVHKKGYKILVDSRVDLQHLKYSDTSTSALLQQQNKTKNDYYYYFEYSKEIRIVG